MGGRSDVPQGALALMVFETLEAMRPRHGDGVARRIGQASEGLPAVNDGTVCPALLGHQQQGDGPCAWGVAGTARRARCYALTRPGRRRPAAGGRAGERAAAVLARPLPPVEELS